MRSIDEALTIRDGHLFIEDVDCVALANRFGTPLFVVSEDQLRRNARASVRAFEDRWSEGPVRILPSIKANFSLALRHILTDEGMGCDTFGSSELAAALRGGVPPDLISVNGSGKTASLIGDAVAVGARITIDAARELPLVEEAAHRLSKQATVRLRVRPDLSELSEPTDFAGDEISVGEATRSYKAGIPTDDVIALGRKAISSEDVHLSGIHVHLPRHRPETGMYHDMIRALVELLAELRREWDGWVPREIDLGGGFAVRRDPTGRLLPRLAHRSELAPTIDDYAETITSSLRSELDRHDIPMDGLALEVEPGRSLYGNAGIHLARVVNVKREALPKPQRWVESDTTEMFLPDSLIEHNRWNVVVATRPDAEPVGPADIVGISCGFDVMVPSEPLPELDEGDVLAFLDTGAYQDASASNFNALPRPASVLVHGDGADLIKRAETIDDVFGRDMIPARLVGASASKEF